MINNFDIRRQRPEKERITLSSSFATTTFFLPSLRNSRSCFCLRLISPTFSQRFSVLHFIHSSFISLITTTTVVSTTQTPMISQSSTSSFRVYLTGASNSSIFSTVAPLKSPRTRSSAIYQSKDIAQPRLLHQFLAATHRPKPMSHEERMMVMIINIGGFLIFKS